MKNAVELEFKVLTSYAGTASLYRILETASLYQLLTKEPCWKQSLQRSTYSLWRIQMIDLNKFIITFACRARHNRTFINAKRSCSELMEIRNYKKHRFIWNWKEFVVTFDMRLRLNYYGCQKWKTKFSKVKYIFLIILIASCCCTFPVITNCFWLENIWGNKVYWSVLPKFSKNQHLMNNAKNRQLLFN